jgi:hypothetical protein
MAVVFNSLIYKQSNRTQYARRFPVPSFEPGGRRFESVRARDKIRVHSGHMGDVYTAGMICNYVPGRATTGPFRRPARREI